MLAVLALIRTCVSNSPNDGVDSFAAVGGGVILSGWPFASSSLRGGQGSSHPNRTWLLSEAQLDKSPDTRPLLRGELGARRNGIGLVLLSRLRLSTLRGAGGSRGARLGLH